MPATRAVYLQHAHAPGERRSAWQHHANRGRWYDDYELDAEGNPTTEDGARWGYYKTRAEGHSTLVINPGTPPETSNLVPAILKSTGDFNGVATPMFVTALTQVYSSRAPWLAVRRVQRGFKPIDRHYLIVQSEVDVVAPVDMWDLYHVKNNDNGVELLDILGPKSAVVRKAPNGEKLVVKILSEQGAFSAPMAADYLAASASIRPTDNGGTGSFEKLGINVTAQNLALCIALAASTEGTSFPYFPPVKSLAYW